MGFLNGMLGNASTLSKEEASKDLEQILTNSEEIDVAFKLIRDLIVFTDKRLLLVDKQGLTGKKVEYHSIPFKSISHFSVETAGHFDLDAELKIWILEPNYQLYRNNLKKIKVFMIFKKF